MNYLQQRKIQQRRRRRLSGTIVIIVTVLVGGLYMFAPGGITGVFHAVASPIWSIGGLFSDGSSSFTGYFTTKSSLQHTNEELREKIKLAEVELGQRLILEEENTLFRDMWSRATTSSGILASVLTTPPQSPHDLVVLDVGSQQGIDVEDRVIYGDVGLGRIHEVYANTAVAELYSTTGVETPGIIVGEDITVTLLGEGGGSFRAEIPKDIDVYEDDIITLPDSRALEFARVVEVRVDPTDSFQHIRARSPLNVTQLRWVRIVDHNEQLF
ncbi:MAG: rod shape-determining protein MreC [Candidatus Paceibacterota bacterium]